MSELVTEIYNHSIAHVILRAPRDSEQSHEQITAIADICGIKKQQVIISIHRESGDLVQELYNKNQVFEMAFELNRLNYQLQHYVWDFVSQHDLHIRLIENSAYRCESPLTEHEDFSFK